MREKIRHWIAELRIPFLTATIVSILLGTSISFARIGAFNPQLFVLTLLGGIFLHLGANVANDYFDHKSGNDEVNKDFVRPFSGGSRTIQLGLLTPREVLLGSITFYAAATAIGLYLAWVTGFFVLFLELIGLISGFLYTFPPFNWASKGVGEAIVGINFGALLTLGSYYVQTQNLSWEPVLASVPISLLICAVLYINEFPDYSADESTGKKTLVVRLGRANAAYGYLAIVTGAYIFVLLNVLMRVTPPYTLVALIPFPLAARAMIHASESHSKPADIVPANALTIAFHFLTSLLISLGYLGQAAETMSIGSYAILALVVICSLLVGYLYAKSPARSLTIKPRIRASHAISGPQ